MCKWCKCHKNRIFPARFARVCVWEKACMIFYPFILIGNSLRWDGISLNRNFWNSVLERFLLFTLSMFIHHLCLGRESDWLSAIARGFYDRENWKSDENWKSVNEIRILKTSSVGVEWLTNLIHSFHIFGVIFPWLAKLSGKKSARVCGWIFFFSPPSISWIIVEWFQ